MDTFNPAASDPSGAKQAAEKGVIADESLEEHTAGAEAHVDSMTVTARSAAADRALIQSIEVLRQEGVFPQPVKPSYMRSVTSLTKEAFLKGSLRKICITPR